MSQDPAPDGVYGPQSAYLHLHPDSACPEVQYIEGRATLLEAGLLSLGFTLIGDLQRLAVPPTGPSERTDRLWEHTCFEAFLALPDARNYLELNLAPSTAWAAMRFSGYREGMEPAEGLDPRIVVLRKDNRLDLHAMVRLDSVFPTMKARPLRIGLSAVIESASGSLSYWAIRHPEGRPDFHSPEGFVLNVVPLPDED